MQIPGFLVAVSQKTTEKGKASSQCSDCLWYPHTKHYGKLPKRQDPFMLSLAMMTQEKSRRRRGEKVKCVCQVSITKEKRVGQFVQGTLLS